MAPPPVVTAEAVGTSGGGEEEEDEPSQSTEQQQTTPVSPPTPPTRSTSAGGHGDDDDDDRREGSSRRIRAEFAISLKALQHELSCTTAVLKVKASELKNMTANQLQKEENSQEVIKAIPSNLATVEAHQIDNKATSADTHHLVESHCKAAVTSNTGRQEPSQDKTNNRYPINLADPMQTPSGAYLG